MSFVLNLKSKLYWPRGNKDFSLYDYATINHISVLKRYTFFSKMLHQNKMRKENNSEI